MPWTVKNPPSVAKNWSNEEKRKCVNSANSVLKETGDEEQAVFACIRSAGKSKQKGKFSISLQKQSFYLSENERTIVVELLKTGKVSDRNITFKKKHLESIVSNFKEMAYGLPVNYNHNVYDVACGWIKELSIEDKEGESYLMATIDFTKTGAEKIKDKEYKFISAEIGGNMNNLKLLGAGLTNVPAVKGMSVISLEEKQFIENFINDQRKEEMKELKEKLSELSKEEKQEVIVYLSEEKTENKDEEATEDKTKDASEEKSKDSEDSKKENPENKKEDKEDSEEKTEDDSEETEDEVEDKKTKNLSEIKKELVLEKRRNKFLTFLSAGQVVPAQQEAFLKNDIEAFIDNAEAINLQSKGSGISKKEKKCDNTQDEILRLAKKKLGSNEKLTQKEAISIVLEENPELSKLYNN